MRTLTKYAARAAAIAVAVLVLAVAPRYGHASRAALTGALRVVDAAPQSAFAARIERLSEPAGEFDTDNLISNEQSYLDIVPALKAPGMSGGVYIGVGPDQNFSYIAALRPSIAFIIDIRRDNLLLHLLFKALFTEARNRA